MNAMSVLSTLNQTLGVFGSNLLILFVISLALPLVLGVLARLAVYREDTEDAVVDGAPNQSSSSAGDSEPDFQPTDWSGLVTHVNILATPQAGASRGKSDNREAGEKPTGQT